MTTRTDILIIGQGICGSFLAWWLQQAGMTFIVIDEVSPFTASRVAAGLINPVTGRRIVKTWMIDELLPFSETTYRRIGKDLRIDCIASARVVDFFPTAQMRNAFLERYAEDPAYLALPVDEGDQRNFFNYDLGYGTINGCLLVDVPALLDAYREHLKHAGCLIEERFEEEALAITGAGIRYKDITAGRIVFCDGMASATRPLFSRLPFAPNKGEGLIVEIPGLAGMVAGDAGVIPLSVFKKGIMLAPWKEGLYWVGSSYEWSFTDEQPTEMFRKRTESILRDWLKVPFKTVQHFASIRPATVERRPFAGVHPLNPTVGILNGMGTKGCSLAPYLAHQLVQYFQQGTPIRPDADIQRFAKILGVGKR